MIQHLVKRIDFDTTLVISCAIAFFVVYLLTFPTGWLVSDVYSYLNQGIAIAHGEKFLTYNDALTNELIPYKGTKYPLGNAFWIALWIKISSLKYVYLGSLFCVLLSTFLTYKILVKESLIRLTSLFFFAYPSLLFFSHSLMSAMPSLLLISAFLYFLFQNEESGKKWFFLSFIAALSFWIRETNLVLLGSICLIHFIQDKRWILFYAGGAILGFLPRLASSNYYYGDPFYYVLAENFSIQNLVNNIGVYLILLLCFMPFGLFFILKYRGRYFFPLLTSTLFFIIMYAFYSFNATAYSGYQKGLILMGRFMIPILPIYIISLGWYFRKRSIPHRVKIVLASFICALLLAMQLMISQEAKIHKKISDHIYTNYSDRMVMFDLSRTTNMVRYINPFHGNLTYMSDISNLKDVDYMNNLLKTHEEVFLIQTLNTANSKKQKLTSRIEDLVEGVRDRYELEEVEIIKIKQGLVLEIGKIGEIEKIGEIGEIEIGENEK